MTDDITLTADEYTVHAREKVSIDEYEPAEYHATIEGSVHGIDDLDRESRRELKARLLTLQKELQETVQRSAENRLREPGHDDWGVRYDNED